LKNSFQEGSVYNCNVFALPKISDRSGNITALNNLVDLPFEIKRVYYLYDVPSGEARGGHAHFDLTQFIIAASGSFDVTIDDGHARKTITLNRPDKALLVVPGIWRELTNFSAGAICLVMASEKYLSEDYIHTYEKFVLNKM
jgi:hypothetical protein